MIYFILFFSFFLDRKNKKKSIINGVKSNPNHVYPFLFSPWFADITIAYSGIYVK